MSKIHFVGIGGISMSALAVLMYDRGHIISGSDLVPNEQTQMLEDIGVKIHIGHRKQNSVGADLVVINGAIADDNPELCNGTKVITREQLLAEIESEYSIRIAVAGTHGKSTTTAMIAAILIQANLDPTVHNGAVMCINGHKSNFIIGNGKIFLTEACEFKRSFLTLNPTIAVITNIDFDHVDCFADLDDTKQAFNQFASKANTVIKTEHCPPINFKLSVPGAHNRENARAAAQVGRALGIDERTIRIALENFCGIDRRFQKIAVIAEGKQSVIQRSVATKNLRLPQSCQKAPEIPRTRMSEGLGMTCHIISDYAHHPAELDVTIATAKSIYNRFLVIFQPHTYTRTVTLFDDFIKVLSTCECVLYKTYAARELPIIGGRAQDLATALGTKYIATPRTLNNFIKKVAHDYDAIILTGAGDMQGNFKED